MSARRKFSSGGGGTQKRLPINTKKGLPHAEKIAKNILLKYSYIFASEKVLRKCNPKCTKLHNKQTFWGVCSNVPLNIHIININVFFCCCVRILIDRKKT